MTEAVDLGAQLPTLICGIYYEGWAVSKVPKRMLHAREFLELMSRDLVADSDPPAETAARAALQVLCKHVTRGEIEHVRKMFPADLRRLWPILPELRSGSR